MTSVRILSDLHLEFGGLQLPINRDEEKDTLVLAGDIGLAKAPTTYRPFFEAVTPHFADIIYIMGNHEHYHGSVDRSLDKIWNELLEFENVHVVNNKVVRIGDTSFVCSTMWASYDQGNPMSMAAAAYRMNDHRIIRTGPRGNRYERRFKPEDAYELHLESTNFIFQAIEDEKAAEQKVCVVTHHAPSYQSISREYASDDVNGAYASDLDELILETQPNLWIHGHMHRSFDYMIGNTRVVCNPRGYYNHDENPTFNSELRITLE